MFTFAADQWNIHKYCRNHKISSSFGYIHVTTAWGKCSETRNWNTKYPLEAIEKWASMAGDYVKKTPTSEEFAFVRCFFFLIPQLTSRWHLWRMLIMPADYLEACSTADRSQDVGRGHDAKTLTLAKILIRFIQYLIHGVSAVAFARYLWRLADRINFVGKRRVAIFVDARISSSKFWNSISNLHKFAGAQKEAA